MLRHTVDPRPDWKDVVQDQGLLPEQAKTWNESNCYEFSHDQIDAVVTATDRINQMCLETVRHLIENKEETFPNFGIEPTFYGFVADSWDEDEQTVLCRYDLAYDGVGAPKLISIDADCPGDLVKTCATQRFWVDEQKGFAQHNLLVEELGRAFERIKSDRELGDTFFVASLGRDDSPEDFSTASYLRDLAFPTFPGIGHILLSEIGESPDSDYFVDSATNEEIKHAFKVYPWDLMFKEDFGQLLPGTKTEFYEPAWKVLLSNRAFLPYLYDLFGDSPYVLKASFDRNDFGDTYVRKPIYTLFGENVQIVRNNEILADVPGDYAEVPVIYQQYCPLPMFAGNSVVASSWVVNGKPCGLGIRETYGLVTNRESKFVPHRYAPRPVVGHFGDAVKKLIGR